MTKLLDQAVKAVRTLSTKSQDEIARTMLYLAKDEPENVDPEHLTSDRLAAANMQALPMSRLRFTDSKNEAAPLRLDA